MDKRWVLFNPVHLEMRTDERMVALEHLKRGKRPGENSIVIELLKDPEGELHKIQ